MNATAPQIWTVGHSNREIVDFLELLTGAGIRLIADVRRFPGSRRYPQFGQEQLASSLHEQGIAYRHFPELGGRRSKRPPDSPNTGWEVEAFNAYADHMDSAEFRTGIQQLMEVAAQTPCAIMCSEAVPWRCHRRLIADYLIVHGWQVNDIISRTRVTPHPLTKFARVENGRLTYPGQLLF